jgi:hypothetical protein
MQAEMCVPQRGDLDCPRARFGHATKIADRPLRPDGSTAATARFGAGFYAPRWL